MRKTIAVVAVSAAAFLVPVAAGAKDEGKHHGGGKAHLVAAGDLKWADDAEHPGVQVAPVSGDPAKGAAKMFIKLPANFSVPLHHHTADHWGVVVSGTMVFNVDGQDQTLPAGSFFGYAGKKQHTTKCTDAAGCLIFVDAHGKWDLLPEKTASK